jgi:hypothetical protein
MLETHIMMSSMIYRLILILRFRLTRTLMSRFSHGPNHHSYDFGSRENHFEPKHFGYGPCPHHGDHFPRRLGFPAGWSYTHFEPRHLYGPRFPRRGSRPTRPSGEVQRTMKTSSGRMVKCWISKIYLINPNTKPSTFCHLVGDRWRLEGHVAHRFWLLTTDDRK